MDLEKSINLIMSTGADFGEIYLEDEKSKVISLVDSKIDKINVNLSKGIGFRIALGEEIYYASTNDFSLARIAETIDELKSSVSSSIKFKNIKLQAKKTHDYKSLHEKKDTDDTIIAKIKEYDKYIRESDKRVSQVDISVLSKNKKVTICNHRGVYTEENRKYNRIFISVIFKDGEKISTQNLSYANTNDDGFINSLDIKKDIDNLVISGVKKLYAKSIEGKTMPVIIENGFGAVIFHEACGHALEAQAVSRNLSILANKNGEKIASEKVTLIDDGTLPNKWGSTSIDDEGIPTKRNILIKGGVLKTYLNDELNNRRLNSHLTGSSRRESYLYAPVSRMNNTYLEKGNDKISDMISSIDDGLYVKSLGGGCVSVETGDFNFAANEAYLIKNGKVTDCVKSASLIGNTVQVLKNIEMVADDLKIDPGMCGASSGWVPVTIGQPTIKVSEILVGGEKND